MNPTLVPAFDDVDTGYYVTSDDSVLFPVVAFTEHGPVKRTRRTGMLGLVTQTGRKIDRTGQIRARVTFARDLGTATGEVTFDGNTVGGYAPFMIFQGR